MKLDAGTRLGPYEILAPIGAGGMGEVYRARDTKLGREVAIKILPEHFADDEERLKRFEREAKTLASLNHPNVAQIFGVDQVGDTCFLVLELVPGESLEERMRRGPRVAMAKALWNDAIRNKAIARVARLVARRNPKQLQQAGIGRLPERATGKPSVCVLVKNTQDAAALKAHLSGALIKHSSSRMKFTPATKPSQIEIATLVAFQKQQTDADVIVVASGGEALPELLKASSGKRRRQRQLVIDFLENDSSKVALQKTRIKAYAKAGWNIVKR
jgi:DNA polymerase IIIc chi subunit